MNDDQTDTEPAAPPKVDGRPPSLRDLVDRGAPRPPAAPGRPAPAAPPTAAPPSPEATPAPAEPGAPPPPDVERQPAPAAAGAPAPGAVDPAEPGEVDPVGPEEGDEGAAPPAEMPLPPSPPFVGDEAPYRWQVTLPSAIGRSLTVRVGPEVIELGGTEIPREEIARGTFKLEVEDALLRRAASARMRIEIQRTDGSSVKVGARNAASAAKASAIIHTVTYLWTLLGDVDGEDRASVVDRIRRGAEVAVGGVRFTSIGLAWKRNPIVTWSRLGDPELHGLDVVIPTDEQPMVIPLTIDGAFMLPVLVPTLRRRFG